MQYLTYEEYTEIGGTLDLTAFNRNIDRACGIIDNTTHNRIEYMDDVPSEKKYDSIIVDEAQDFDIDMVFNTILEKSRYISDGNIDTITTSSANESLISDTETRKVILY